MADQWLNIPTLSLPFYAEEPLISAKTLQQSPSSIWIHPVRDKSHIGLLILPCPIFTECQQRNFLADFDSKDLT
jgi:hypothetical protein